MSSITDVIAKLEKIESELNELVGLLMEVERSEAMMEELEYDFNMFHINWNYFMEIKESAIGDVIEAVREFMVAHNNQDKDAIREKSKALAVLVRDNQMA